MQAFSPEDERDFGTLTEFLLGLLNLHHLKFLYRYSFFIRKPHTRLHSVESVKFDLVSFYYSVWLISGPVDYSIWEGCRHTFPLHCSRIVDQSVIDRPCFHSHRLKIPTPSNRWRATVYFKSWHENATSKVDHRVRLIYHYVANKLGCFFRLSPCLEWWRVSPIDSCYVGEFAYPLIPTCVRIDRGLDCFFILLPRRTGV